MPEGFQRTIRTALIFLQRKEREEQPPASTKLPPVEHLCIDLDQPQTATDRSPSPDRWHREHSPLLPVRTVGLMGDGRTYDQVCGLRAVTSVDGMTADSYPFEHALLSRVATRTINEVRGINRVVYDITSKPPGTIEWE
jgi:hypothetical protein